MKRLHMTEFHASYYAHKLILKNYSNDTEKLARAIMNSDIDLLPHQIEAALFFNSSPLSEGVLIADEVGLGKTIEAGLILRQYWNEGKRKILIIVPASLRKQWAEELRSKFFIDSIIFDTDTYKSELKKGSKNPLDQEDKIVICSYHFAAKYEIDISNIEFDLAVLDEAHKIRNSWKVSGAVISKSIRESLFGIKKLLLTATPLHNSMKDLVGILQFIDDSLDASQWRDSKNNDEMSLSDEDYSYLETRVGQICNRTLRADVTDYINYTNREVLLHKYKINKEEQKLYTEVLNFFAKDESDLYNKKAKHLLQIAALKLLSSSPKAVSSFLGTLLDNYEHKKNIFNINEFIDVENDDNMLSELHITTVDTKAGIDEIAQLKEIKALADSITEDSKLTELVDALNTGFIEQEKIGAVKKVIIFTESIPTQYYLKEHLESIGYKDKIVIFNGENNSADSIAIYNVWKERHKGSEVVSGIKSVDIRQSLIDCFRESAEIMISTESGGEGVNLQFCNMIVNYDLPWNPQRIEQRIGRCHRYGQKYDVLIINFLNTNNIADERVYQLLDQKFKLFDGIFGSSNEILGTIESGVDIEKRIHQIYSSNTTEDKMGKEFDKLERELETQLHKEQKSAQYKLLDNLSTGKQMKLLERQQEIELVADQYLDSLWSLTTHTLSEYLIIVDEEKKVLKLHTSPHPDIPKGIYSVYQTIDGEGRVLRENTPLGQYIFDKVLKSKPEPEKLIFKCNGNYNELIGKTGFLKCSILCTRGFEESEHLLLSAIDDDLEPIEQDTAKALFELPVVATEATKITKSISSDLDDVEDDIIFSILDDLNKRNQKYISDEQERLGHIANQQIEALEALTEKNIKAKKQEYRLKGLEKRKLVKEEEKNTKELVSRVLERNKHHLLLLQARLNQPYEKNDIFIIEWEVT